MHLGFTGTQSGMTKEQKKSVRFLINQIAPLWAHHGDCIGADEEFDKLCVEFNVKREAHPCTIKSKRANCKCDIIHKPKEPLVRNTDIVIASSIMIATPREFEEIIRSGTWATVRRTKRYGKKLHIITPDGGIRN